MAKIADSVTSTVLHPMGTVAATCSGQRHYPDASNGETANADNSLKVWSMPFLDNPPDCDYQYGSDWCRRQDFLTI